MTDFLKSIQDALIARMNNMLFVNFIIAWIFINYNHSLTILFKEMSIDEKIKYIDDIEFDVWLSLGFPLLITAIYIFAMPILNLLVSQLHSKVVEPHIKNHENDKLKEYYKRKKEIEIIRLESTVFVERDLSINKEQIESAAKQKNIKLNEEENRIREANIKLEEKEHIIIKEKILLVEKENTVNQEKLELAIREAERKKNYIEFNEKDHLERIKIIKQTEKKFLEQQGLLHENERELVEQQKAIQQAEKELAKQLKAIQEAEKIYINHKKVRQVLEQQKAKQEAYEIDDDEKSIIKIIALHNGQISGPNLTTQSNFDNVKTEYLVEKMTGKFISPDAYPFNSTANRTTLTTLGKKVAIDEGFSK